MKIAFIADTHFGVRKNSIYFMDQQKKYYEEHFFPYLKKHDIKTVIHLGDLFDNRKTVNFDTLRHANDCFINPIIKNDIELHMITGNHDSYYKSSGDLISTKLLFSGIPNITVYNSLSHVMFGDKRFMMIPWIYPIQTEETSEKIRVATDDVCCGHFDMIGVVYQGSTVSRKGLDTDIFSHFDHVFSGHYHKKSQYYVGSPYQMTWADYEDKKRIIIYDTETNETEDIYLGDDIFVSLNYPGQKDHSNLHGIENKIVRIIVDSKDIPSEFEDWIGIVEAHEPYDIDVKEKHLYVDVIEDDELDDETDTLGVMLKSIDDLDLKEGERGVIKEILKQLYEKAKKV